MSIVLKCRQWPHALGLPLPAYQTDQAAGLDLAAAVPADRPLTLQPMARAMVPTGLSLEVPAGYECQIRPRSGLAARQGVTVLNSPGTVDADYRGEIMVILVNLGSEPVTVTRGDRIAQMVIAPVSRVVIAAVDDLGETPRGNSGFGSTGLAGLASPDPGDALGS